MAKPKVGDVVRLVGDQVGDMEFGRVYATYDRIDVWWDTGTGENKVALMDALEEYGPELASTATWYAEVENTEYQGETMAVASFECRPM